MDVPTLMHNLKEEVTCSVCIHLYTNPKQLPCLHIFCLECLNDLARTSARHGKIKCPICQTEVAVPDNGTMETLPNCFYVKNLLDTLAIKQCDTSRVTCGNCDEKSEEASYCFHCGKFWCKDCLNGHNILRENKEHRVLALKDFQDEDFKDVLRRPAFCQKELHEKELLKFYCKVCEVPVCQTCVIVHHNKHEVEHLELAARAVKGNVTVQVDIAKKRLQTCTDYLQELEEKCHGIENRSKAVKEQIKHAVKLLMVNLQQQEQKLIVELETQSKEALEDLTKTETMLREQSKKIKKVVSQAERLIELSNGAELVQRKVFLTKLFQELPPEEGPKDMASSCEEIDLHTVFTGNEEISEMLQNAVIGYIDRNKTATKAHQYIAVEFLSRKDEFDSPWGIAVNASNDVIVTDMGNQCVKIFSVKDRVVLTQSFGQKLFGQPTGICVDVEGRIYVADKQKNTISLFSSDGKKLGAIGKDQNGDTRLKEPRGISLDSQGNIVVCGSGNKCVKVLSSDGTFLRTIGVGKFKEPFDCLCHKDELYVSDRAGNAVKVFNYFSGTFLYEFGKDGSGKGEVRRPTGLAVDRTGHLLVCSQETKRVQIYKLDGTHVTNFGDNGRRLGQFGLPNSISVLMDGRIVVADFSNGELQIFE